MRTNTAGRMVVGYAVALALLAVIAPQSFAAPKSCEALASLKLPDTTITSAMTISAGSFTPPVAPGAEAPPGGLKAIQVPSFCRVQLTVAPAVKIEVWLPVADWNGNFEAVGGMGFAGVISYGAMGTALQAGFATASTNTGHDGNRASFAFGDPNTDPAVKTRIEDFAYLAVHEMTVKGKQVIESFYGKAPKFSYFNGCSTGGRQALEEAQRYPTDYNGILAGAPALDYPDFMVAHLWVGIATLKDEGNYIPAEKLPAINDASLQACDTLDGVKDGLIGDPRLCKFDPVVLICKGTDSSSCLTAKQVKAVKDLYSGPHYSDGKLIYPGRMPGGERGWTALTGPAPYKSGQFDIGVDWMRSVVYRDPNWDFHTWDFEKGMPLVENPWIRSVLVSSNPNLKPFRKHRGKLILYQGWSDQIVSPLATINYYKSVVDDLTGKKSGGADMPETREFDRAAEQTGNFFRMFMAPGMYHCGGGPGPNTFNGMMALADWVEHAKAPDEILATHSTDNVTDSTRPLCPYPMTAQSVEAGGKYNSSNLVCKLPDRR